MRMISCSWPHLILGAVGCCRAACTCCATSSLPALPPLRCASLPFLCCSQLCTACGALPCSCLKQVTELCRLPSGLSRVSCGDEGSVPGTGFQGAEGQLKPPAGPARLPFAAELTWQRALRRAWPRALLLTDFLGQPWRPSGLGRLTRDVVNRFPSKRAGQCALALFRR